MPETESRRVKVLAARLGLSLQDVVRQALDVVPPPGLGIVLQHPGSYGVISQTTPQPPVQFVDEPPADAVP